MHFNIILLWILAILIIINFNIIKIYVIDYYFIIKKKLFYTMKYDNNLLEYNNNNINENTKILIISFDNREKLKYLQLHNDNIENYCKKWKNIDYEFINKCDKNIYWCKLYLLLEKLNSNKYDYVMWMDTDTFIVKQDFSLQQLINSYSSDIYIGHDKIKNNLNTLCAGVFIIKNSEIGKKFIIDCIDYHEKSNCILPNNKLNGVYAQMCYEQGVMNYFIYEKYFKNTTILKPNIINNDYECLDNVFILHKFGSPEDAIFKCFTDLNIKINNENN